MTEQINNCPYCGSDTVNVLVSYVDIGLESYFAQCANCDTRAPWHTLKTKAISLWNQMQVKDYSQHIEDSCCCDDCIRELEAKEEKREG